MTKTVVILGASYAGLHIAHKLLKNTLPAVSDLKVVLVAPSSKLYWNIASVRAIVPGQFKDEQIFGDFLDGFKKYPAGSFEFIEGAATGLEVASHTVEIKTAAGIQEQKYDQLVIATGSSTPKGIPWKAAESYEATLDALHATQEKVKNAQTIVVGGAGATGMEVVGELGYEYGKTKDISIISSSAQVLPGSVSPSIAKGAQNTIEKMKVKVILNTKVSEVAPTADGKTELTLSDGKKFTVDLYLPTTGLIPNTSFVPPSFLNDQKLIKVSPTLSVIDAADVWAVGDVVDIERAQLVLTEKQAKTLAANLNLVLKGQNPVNYKTGSPMIGVTLGRSTGIGMAGTWKVPGFFIWLAKGRDIATGKLPGVLSGAAY